MEINKVHNIDFLNNTLPDKCANLIIADPPYYKVKGDFDFIWKTFDDYLLDVDKWAKECKRLLTDNGTLFWWGMDRKIAYAQIVLDKYFELIGTPVWEKPSNPNEWDTRRTFPERGAERLLMYSNETNDDDYKRVIYGLKEYTSYMNEIKNKLNLTDKQLNKNFGYVAGCSWWFSKKQPRLINEIDYNKLQKMYPEFNKNYCELKKVNEIRLDEFDLMRRPFNNTLNLTDIMRFSRENNTLEHDTKKPEKLTRALIMTTTRKNDLVVVPFAGSGTECAMAVKENCNFYGFEITKKHADMSNKRVSKIMCNPCLPFE